MKPSRTYLGIFSFCAISAFFSSCMGNQRQGVASGLVAEQPYTEAYIEFTGPGERWGGPTTFALQVQAKDEKQIRVVVLPKGIFPKKGKSKEISVKTRELASSETGTLNLLQLRDRLASLSEVIDEGSGNFSGCLYPIKVRLVRVDGAVKDWQGCRGIKGPARGVSEFTSELLSIYAGT